ncbi:MAG: hypothetical protein Q8O32_03310 [bacterium]|nr:hypothetical protein [bacterium]
MIIISKKLFLKNVLVLFEDDKVPEIIKNGHYSRVIVSSYNKLDLEGFSLKIKTTALIDLDQDLETIFSKFSDTTRNEIRKTYKNQGLSFQFLKSISEEVHQLYKEFEYLQGRVPVGKKNLKNCLFFGAYYNNELISGIYVMALGKYLRIRSIFSRRLKLEDKEKIKVISNASRRIVWEIVQWGRKNSYQCLDLASVNFKNPKTANITKFKMSFAGRVVEEYTYTYNSALYKTAEKIAKWKNKVFKWKNKVFKK